VYPTVLFFCVLCLFAKVWRSLHSQRRVSENVLAQCACVLPFCYLGVMHVFFSSAPCPTLMFPPVFLSAPEEKRG